MRIVRHILVGAKVLTARRSSASFDGPLANEYTSGVHLVNFDRAISQATLACSYAPDGRAFLSRIGITGTPSTDVFGRMWSRSTFQVTRSNWPTDCLVAIQVALGVPSRCSAIPTHAQPLLLLPYSGAALRRVFRRTNGRPQRRSRYLVSRNGLAKTPR
jgi:hypothetical protein